MKVRTLAIVLAAAGLFLAGCDFSWNEIWFPAPVGEPLSQGDLAQLAGQWSLAESDGTVLSDQVTVIVLENSAIEIVDPKTSALAKRESSVNQKPSPDSIEAGREIYELRRQGESILAFSKGTPSARSEMGSKPLEQYMLAKITVSKDEVQFFNSQSRLFQKEIEAGRIVGDVHRNEKHDTSRIIVKTAPADLAKVMNDEFLKQAFDAEPFFVLRRVKR